tara:strand:+ start:102 stop:278 length:177 start_codon:yes stop_codon:yes gene_type:complete
MKSFKEFMVEEPTVSTGPSIAGTSPGDPADWTHGKKKKRRPLTRSYIEVMGKRKKLVK